MKIIKWLPLILIMVSCDNKPKAERPQRDPRVDVSYCIDACIENLTKNAESQLFGGASANLAANPIDTIAKYCAAFFENKECCESVDVAFDGKPWQCLRRYSGTGKCACDKGA